MNTYGYMLGVVYKGSNVYCYVSGVVYLFLNTYACVLGLVYGASNAYGAVFASEDLGASLTLIGKKLWNSFCLNNL